jgi:hypothetical protein
LRCIYRSCNGSNCEELKVRNSSPHYPNDQTRFCKCEKFRRRANNRRQAARRKRTSAVGSITGPDHGVLGASFRQIESAPKKVKEGAAKEEAESILEELAYPQLALRHAARAQAYGSAAAESFRGDETARYAFIHAKSVSAII